MRIPLFTMNAQDLRARFCSHEWAHDSLYFHGVERCICFRRRLIILAWRKSYGFWRSTRLGFRIKRGVLRGKRYLIHDRDPLFTRAFLSTLQDGGVQSVRLPPRSPNLNAHAERFVRSIRESCLDRLILFGESSLRKAIQDFMIHYQRERNHQGLGNQLIEPEPDIANTGPVQRRQRLGGMLNYYYRAAA